MSVHIAMRVARPFASPEVQTVAHTDGAKADALHVGKIGAALSVNVLKHALSDSGQSLMCDVTRWMRDSHRGFCGITTTKQARCSVDGKGSFGLSQQSSATFESAVTACMRRCAACARCNYVTINPGQRDCSWYHACDLSRLSNRWPGFRSGAVDKQACKTPLDYGADEVVQRRSQQLQRVVLFMHLEKTGGTTVRTFFDSSWAKTSFCMPLYDVLGALVSFLEAGKLRIFIEYHCNIDWDVPAAVASEVERANRKGFRVRFRSFTTLRSPLTLTYSQYNYWHANSFVPLDLFTSLAPELLLFRDPLKRLEEDQRGRLTGRSFSDTERSGGIFLDLKLEPAERGVLYCYKPRWRKTCSRLVYTFRKREAIEDRRRNLTARPEAERERAFVNAAEMMVRHADRVHVTVLARGCESLLKEATARLRGFTHVFFTDAAKFSFMHARLMGLSSDSEETETKANTAVRAKESYDEEHALEHNVCADHVYGQLWARLSSSAYAFEALAEQDALVPTMLSPWTNASRRRRLPITPHAVMHLE